MTMNETEYPVLMTVNSKYYEKVWCDVGAGWIKMKFNSWDAYNYAWNSWHDVSRPKWGDYVVITPEKSCINYDDTQQRHFIRAVDESRDNTTMTITCGIEAVSFADTVGPERPVEVEFENFNQNDVSAQAEEADPSADFDDLGGEVLKDPSGDSDFDVYLDAKIGRMDLASLNNSTLAQFNLTLEDFYGESDLPDLVAGSLVKRRIGSRIRRAVRKVAAAVKKAVKVVVEVVKKIDDVIVEVAQAVGDAIADFTTIDRTLNSNINFDSTKLGTVVRTPFDDKLGYQLAQFSGEKDQGNGVTVKGNVDILCVECGVNANIDLRGKVVFIVSRLQFEEGFIEIKGNMGAGLGLGIVADVSIAKEFIKQITSLPLQPFSIANVFVLGPKFDLSAGVELELQLEGQILAGVSADWPSISARIDIVDSDNSFATGFRPTITPIFEVEASVNLKTTFFLEGSLGVGIDIGNGLFDKSVALVDRPGIFVSAGVGASFTLEDGLGGFGTGDDDDDEECRGVNLAIGFSNEVSVNVFDIDKFSKVIDKQEVPIASRCFTLFKRDLPPLDGPMVPATHAIEGRQNEESAPPIGETTFDGGVMAKMFTRNEAESFRLRYSPNGNTYAVAESKVPAEDKDKEWSGWFAADESGAFVFGDSHGRFYHAYQDTLAELGVSRLRLHKPDRMPKTATPVVFASVVDDGVAGGAEAGDMPYLMVSDLGGDIFFPVICVYASDQVYPKVFLVKDVEAGVATLTSNRPEVLQAVTGGSVKQCGYVALTNGVPGSDVGLLEPEEEEE
ncbi:hypothetical protein N658DRAFT_123209 [Parathielavia hyrcaniae]|uniref:Uncharacterized protein n=1 Tax=Parathielavia hyrcaniae TaxID=113614 RepID=A0AAN6T696_9PEZI|nr:hypothetical protein N658DRAFT_123209 [Parathielavia hyrcaniae]